MKSFLDFEEKNVEKAVQKACEDLNVSREKLKYDIISHGSSGIFGLVGAKKALIRVFVPDLQGVQSTSKDSSDTGLDDATSNSTISQTDRETVSALVDEAFGEIIEPGPVDAPLPVPEKKSRKPKKIEKTEKRAKAIKTPKVEKKEKVETKAETPSVGEPPEKIDNEVAMAAARELAQKIFETLSIDAEMSVSSDSDQCIINVKVGEPGILIGKRGQMLEAIQYLVDKVVSKQCGKGNRVIFDVEGYVESRKTELKDLASRLASKVIKTGKPSTMTRMNAHDRRIVHVALKRNRSVRTQSVGDGYYRKLIIFPKNKVQKKTEQPQSKE